MFGLVGVAELRRRSCAACYLFWHLRLDNSAAYVVGLLLDLGIVATRGALIGLTLGMSVGTLGNGACGCIEHFICLLSLVWHMGGLAGVCTLGTCCMLRI